MTARRDFGRLPGEIQDLLADLWQIPRVAGMREGFRPPTDCFRTEDPPELVVVVDVAGVDPEAIEVVVAGRDLLVSGERPRPPSRKRRFFRQMEIDYGRFERLVPLGEEVDVARARAVYRGGLLTVVLPVAAKPARTERMTIVVTTRT